MMAKRNKKEGTHLKVKKRFTAYQSFNKLYFLKCKKRQKKGENPRRTLAKGVLKKDTFIVRHLY
jgi:hypothetical protein